MKIDEFKKEVKALGLELDKEKEELLEKYYIFLKEYNEHTNLTAITEKDDVYLKHFYDSLTVCKVIDFKNVGNMIDIGSGAGFPGMVLKIFFPHVKLTMLDSNNKKTTFLSKVVELLNLKDVNIVNQRAEDYAITHHGKYDLCTSRAVAFIDIITSLSLPLVSDMGKVVLMKGNLTEEEKILEKHSFELGIKKYAITHFKLPISQDERNIVVIERNNNISILNYSQIVKRNKKWKNELMPREI